MLTHDEHEALRLRLERAIKANIKRKRIRAIVVNSAMRWQPPLRIEVGKACAQLEIDAPLEVVVAIFESTAFLVVTQHRGIDTPLPYYFSREDVRRVFEGTPNRTM